jgi:radical SAM protein with 4Fe4S-binding SPASM domain
MSYPSFKRLVDEVSPWLKAVQWSGMCEPLLYEDSLDFLTYLSDAGIRVRVDTNGHFFRNRDFVDRLIETQPSEINIAVDGTDQASLAAVRGPNADFQRLVAGIRLLVAARDRFRSQLKVNLQFIISRPNEHLMGDFAALARSLRPNSMTLKAIRLDPNDKPACRRLMPRSTSYRGYKKKPSGMWELKGKMLRQCWAIRSYCVIWWDGTLLPCCFDLAGEYAFGNVFTTSFKEAWSSDAAIRFRQRASSDLPSIPLCEICPVGRSEINCWEFDLKEEEGRQDPHRSACRHSASVR